MMMDMEPVGSHSFEDHTSEVAIRLRAPTLAGLFAEAGRALAEVMNGGLPPAGAARSEPVILASRDLDALLVDWLNLLILRSETERVLFTGFAFDEVADCQLVATIRGAPAPSLRSIVKAASYHGVRVARDGDGYSATVVLDV